MRTSSSFKRFSKADGAEIVGATITSKSSFATSNGEYTEASRPLSLRVAAAVVVTADVAVAVVVDVVVVNDELPADAIGSWIIELVVVG